jgi:AAA ATPase domain
VTAMISDSSLRACGTSTPGRQLAGQEVIRGRTAEQKIVRDLLRRAWQGRGGVVLVEGEPGLGKSLLLRDSTNEAARHGFSLAAGAADQLSQAIPFSALRTALPEPFARLATDSRRDRPDAIAWWIGQLRAHLEQRAAANPVLVCLDDVQWASPATLAALRTLPRELKWHPVAWILARCSTAQHDTEYLFSLLEKDGAARIGLGPLGDDAVAGLLADAFGAPPDQDLLALASGAAGNPALLTELARGLADDHSVEVTRGRAVLVSTRLPERMGRLAQQRLASLSARARHLLVTAAVLGPSFRLEDAAEMLGETPAALLPTVGEAMGAGIMTADSNAFSFRHLLLGRAVGDMIPRPAREALHRQYGQILLGRGESAALAAGHLLQAAHPGDPAALADLDTASAQTLRSAPQTAADLALRALELTPPADPGALSRAVAAAEALTAAGRLDQAARTARHTLAKPLPPIEEARLRCVLSSVLCARGQARDAAAEARMALAQPQLPGDLRDQLMAAQLQALARPMSSPRTSASAPVTSRAASPAPSPHWKSWDSPSSTSCERDLPLNAGRREDSRLPDQRACGRMVQLAPGRSRDRAQPAATEPEAGDRFRAGVEHVDQVSGDGDAVRVGTAGSSRADQPQAPRGGGERLGAVLRSAIAGAQQVRRFRSRAHPQTG